MTTIAKWAHTYLRFPSTSWILRICVMLGYLLGLRATKEERVSVGKKCSTRVSAVKQCLSANPKNKDACDAFSQDLDLCKGRVVCVDAAAEFSRCTHLVINHTGVKADTPDCGKALRKLRKCLKTKRVLGSCD